MKQPQRNQGDGRSDYGHALAVADQNEHLATVLRGWDVQLAAVRKDIDIQGSPERSRFRCVVEANDGRLYVLEQLLPGTEKRKTAIAARLKALATAGLAVAPYLTTAKGKHLLDLDGYCWQLSPFIRGIPLNREKYWGEAWRGRAIARFLVSLYKWTATWPRDEPAFSLPDYIRQLMGTIRRHNSELIPALQPICDRLEEAFFPPYDNLPVVFSHGDPHPVNTIWGRNCILSVIDWEFCGWKPILYDAALIVGCVGSEASSARRGAFVKAFMETISQSAFFPKEQLPLLPLFTLALRFAWLSEWLRKRDVEMIDFELFYMKLLLEDSPLDGSSHIY
jgi:homoserine kinase type II